ncbi:hypothetical protein R1flu_000529 [Riccia fluitans]|uniref:Secreted protein n=1 Tax=Riccia fluitans TaxID=41844 RepID=A0ABD1Y0P2_9MARC
MSGLISFLAGVVSGRATVRFPFFPQALTTAAWATRLLPLPSLMNSPEHVSLLVATGTIRINLPRFRTIKRGSKQHGTVVLDDFHQGRSPTHHDNGFVCTP